MAKHSPNRLQSLWPSQSADGKPSALPDAQALAERIQPIIASAGTAIAEHPRTSLTVAATLGVVLGWFIKRK